MLVDQIRSIDVDYLVGDPVDYLTRDQLGDVELALAHYLGVQDVGPPRPRAHSASLGLCANAQRIYATAMLPPRWLATGR